MKKYINPEMKELAFVAEEAISSNAFGGNLGGSYVTNDVDFGGLGGNSGEPLNG